MEEAEVLGTLPDEAATAADIVASVTTNYAKSRRNSARLVELQDWTLGLQNLNKE